MAGHSKWKNIQRTKGAQDAKRGKVFTKIAREIIVAVKDGDETVGMARVVSDGGYVYFIADVLVLPEYQRKGIGKSMMEMIMEYLNSKLKEGYCFQVDLLAAKGRERFYEEFGFIKRPNENYGCGMTQKLKWEEGL